jgi:hypothetical protein
MKPKPGACKHLYAIQVRKHKPVLVGLHCGKAVA